MKSSFSQSFCLSERQRQTLDSCPGNCSFEEDCPSNTSLAAQYKKCWPLCVSRDGLREPLRKNIELSTSFRFLLVEMRKHRMVTIFRVVELFKPMCESEMRKTRRVYSSQFHIKTDYPPDGLSVLTDYRSLVWKQPMRCRVTNSRVIARSGLPYSLFSISP